MALLPTKQRDQVLFMVCLFSLGALGLYYQYVWSKKQVDLDTTQERVETLEALNARAKRDMARGSVTLLKKEADRLRGELDIMRQLVPTSNEVPVLLDQVSSSARRVGLEVFDVQPDTMAVVGEHFDVQRYRMIVSGDYHNIAAFFTHVGSLTRIVTPQNLELTISRRQTDRKMAPLQARLEAKFEIQTYVAHGMPSADALATPAVGVNAQGGRP
jgi:type IV pilus assembly protein PilO